MKIYFSRHAKRQMKWRGITEDEVREAVFHSEEISNSIKGRENAFKHIGKKWLKVTFAKESNRAIVITAIDKNK